MQNIQNHVPYGMFVDKTLGFSEIVDLPREKAATQFDKWVTFPMFVVAVGFGFPFCVWLASFF